MKNYKLSISGDIEWSIDFEVDLKHDDIFEAIEQMFEYADSCCTSVGEELIEDALKFIANEAFRQEVEFGWTTEGLADRFGEKSGFFSLDGSKGIKITSHDSFNLDESDFTVS